MSAFIYSFLLQSKNKQKKNKKKIKKNKKKNEKNLHVPACK